MQRVLVPVDGSEGALEAAEYAARLCQGMKASLELVYIYDAPTAALMGLTAVHDVGKIKARVAGAKLDKAVQRIQSSTEGPVAIAEHITIGHPAQEICGYAKEQGHDLIVMGSRGQSEVRELLVGSVSQAVLHHAPCPVLIVR